MSIQIICFFFFNWVVCFYCEVLSHTCQNGYHQSINKQVLVRMWGKGNCALLVGMQTGTVTVETVWSFLKKL